MRQRRELLRPHQISLLAMFELLAASALFFAIAPRRDMVLLTIMFAVLATWSARVSEWSVRWPMIVWLGGCSLLCLGLACLEQAFMFNRIDAQYDHYVVFFGTMIAVLGAIFGIAGLMVLASVICGAGRGR